jgi:hypothetical protein
MVLNLSLTSVFLGKKHLKDERDGEIERIKDK